jgi:hypothetical protein
LKPDYEKAIPPKYDTRKNKEVKDDGQRKKESERDKSNNKR